MTSLPKKLQKKLDIRKENNALRKLPKTTDLIDFSSNDYLGFSSSKMIFDHSYTVLKKKQMYQNGATGSRLLSGNHSLYKEVEKELVAFHQSEAALIFNSGYDANVGFFSSVPQRGDIILYDELIHASIRDGIQMSTASSYKFTHNNVEDLEKKLQNYKSKNKEFNTESVAVYVVTESVFSMDGDSPDLSAFVSVCNTYRCRLIIDEAHALGVFGAQGAGLLQELGLEHQVFARIITFGKAMGCHGAAILGAETLKSYLVNFSRSFIYTTGLPPHSLATILSAYHELKTTTEIEQLLKNIQFFNQKLVTTHLASLFIKSNSAIHCCVISGNEKIKEVAYAIQQKGYNIKPILSPTVPKGKERLRFCLHSYNSKEEIKEVLEVLATFTKDLLPEKIV